MEYFSTDDIVQIGTPPGAAAIGALRLSGANAFPLLAAILSEKDARTLRGTPRPERSCRDVAVLLPLRGMRERARRSVPCPGRIFLMPAPASYTREDVAELHLPGCPALLRAAMDALAVAGARPAAAGEFTFRAFRNGRLSLGQAESVERVIVASSAEEKQFGLARLGDRTAGRLAECREKVLEAAAELERALDFPEEDEPGGSGSPGFARRLSGLLRGLTEAAGGLSEAEGFAAPEISLNGTPHLALVGLANAGKSSLYNALLGTDRHEDGGGALVSLAAGTTRDSLRSAVHWSEATSLSREAAPPSRGTELLLSDNPGFDPGGRGSGGRAAARAMERLGGEDITVWVVDASRPLDAADEAFAERLPSETVVVLNKIDLPRRTDPDRVCALAAAKGVSVLARAEASAAAGTGIPELRAVLAALAARTEKTAAAWTHRESAEIRTALECCRAAAKELAGAGWLELAADDLRRAAEAFSRALGEGYAEEALTRIFSKFCIGK